MPKCAICQKGPQTGHSVSHANNKTLRRWLPNLQSVRVMWEGSVRSIKVCTRCLRGGKIVKAARGREVLARARKTGAAIHN